MSGSSRRKPSQLRSQATVDSILEAGIDLIADVGVEGLSTSEIAARARVPIGSLYQYFADKEAIIDGLIARRIHLIDELFGRALLHLPLVKAASLIEVSAEGQLAFYRENPRMVKVWLGGRLSPTVCRRVQERTAHSAAVLRAIWEAGRLIKPNTPDRKIDLPVALFDRVMKLAFNDSPTGDEAIIADGVEMLVGRVETFASKEGLNGIPHDLFVKRLRANYVQA